VPSESGEAASAGSIGLGFAIPADLAISEFNEIIATGKVNHAYTGLQAEPVRGWRRGGQHLPGSPGYRDRPADPAQAAGLRTGDIITALNAKPAVSTDQLVSIMLKEKPAGKLTIAYQRSGKAAQAQLTLGAQP
jgi:putative serine protease PepD